MNSQLVEEANRALDLRLGCRVSELEVQRLASAAVQFGSVQAGHLPSRSRGNGLYMNVDDGPVFPERLPSDPLRLHPDVLQPTAHPTAPLNFYQVSALVPSKFTVITLAAKRTPVSFFALLITILPIFGARDLEAAFSVSIAVWFTIAALLYTIHHNNLEAHNRPTPEHTSMLASHQLPSSLHDRDRPPAMPTERDPTQVVDELVGAIRNLASDQNYKIVADVVSEALILKETNARLQSSHREVLEEYRKFRNELEVTETKLVTEKATLQAAIEKKDAKLEKLTARNTKLGDEVEKAKKRLDEESKKWVELVEVKNNLDKQVGALKSTLDDTSKVLGDLKAAKTNVDGELTEAKKSLAKRNTELASLEAAKSEVATLLHSTKASLDEKTKLAEELALTKEVLITELAGTTAKLNGKSKELDQLAKTKAALDTQLANVNMRLDKKIKELDGFSEAKASLEADLAHANTGLDVKSKEAEELSSLLADVGSKLDEKSKGLAETVRAKNELEAQLAEVDTQLDSEQVAKRILEEELVGIKFCLAQEIERANSLANEAAGLQQTVKDRNVEIIRLKGDVTGSKDLVEKANGAIKELETDVENLHQELQVKGARLNEIQGYQAQLKNDPEDH